MPAKKQKIWPNFSLNSHHNVCLFELWRQMAERLFMFRYDDVAVNVPGKPLIPGYKTFKKCSQENHDLGTNLVDLSSLLASALVSPFFNLSSTTTTPRSSQGKISGSFQQWKVRQT